MNNQRDKYLAREELKRQIKEKQGWYFITFACELPTHRPYGFTLFNDPFVLLKDNSDNLVCYLLPSEAEDERMEVLSFKVIEKQGEIWFWRGKIKSQ